MTPGRRLRLRTRITLAFGIGALALSASLSTITFHLARNYLLSQRDRSIQRQTFASARVVRESLQTPDSDVPRLLTALRPSEGSAPVIERNGDWYGASLAVGRDDIPAELREAVADGRPGRQLFVGEDGQTKMAIGIPLPAVGAAYFEVFPLEVLSRTLLVLRNSLAAGAVVTTLAGAGLGLVASRRVLRPVADVAEAASAVASGDLSVRLDDGGDPDLARLAKAFNHMTSAVADRIKREERFAATVSHELRTPLTTLAATVEVLQTRRGELSTPGQSALSLLSEEVVKFDQLVKDLLEMSRLDAGAAEVSFDEVVIGELVLRVLDEIGGEPVPVAMDDSAMRLFAQVDKRRFERIMANLIGNARSHGRGVLQVAVGAGPTPGTARLTVDDSGPGVDDDEAELVFERFVRGRRATARNGSGLGLALVMENVRLHDGQVWVERSPSGGARFVVELPADEAMP